MMKNISSPFPVKKNAFSLAIMIKSKINKYVKQTENSLSTEQPIKTATVTYIQSLRLRVLGATPGAVLSLNNRSHWKRLVSPRAPYIGRNLFPSLWSFFYRREQRELLSRLKTGQSPRAVLKQIVGNIFILVQLEGLNCL